ncbi:MAG: hypothetical protein WKG07_31820 [Hymenobacter sp.]
MALRCDRLPLATDTLRHLAVRVRHDGERVLLSGIRGQVLGGEVSGQAQWPTDSANLVVPVSYNLNFKLDTLSYTYLLNRLTHPPQRSARSPRSPALRELLLAANGKLNYQVNSLRLPNGEQIRDLASALRQARLAPQPALRVLPGPARGVGSGSATVQLQGVHLVRADANLYLRYPSLDVPALLRMLASVAPARADSATLAGRRAARAARRAARLPAGSAAPAPVSSVIADGRFTALLRVEADHVRYAAVRGTQFQLVSRLQAGEAIVDDCTVNALGGRVSLHGRLRTDAGRRHHPWRPRCCWKIFSCPNYLTRPTICS